MSKKVLFLLAVGYVAWNIVWSMFSSRRSEDIKKDISKAKKGWEDTTEIYFDTVVDVNSNMYNSFKECVFTPKNKKLLANKKAELFDYISRLKEESLELLENAKEVWKEKSEDAIKMIENFYKTKKIEILEKFSESKEELSELQDKLEKEYKKLKDNFSKK